MAKTDLSGLTKRQLDTLKLKIEEALAEQHERDRLAAIKVIEAKSQELGFSLSELIDPQKRRRAKAPVKPKYQHPENPMVTWSGRGRRPRWVQDWQARGEDLEDLSIR